MDYSGNGDYDVNTPFKFEGDDQDQPSGGVEDSRTVHHSQDDLIYPPLDFAAPTPTPQHGDTPSTSTSNSHNNMMDAQPSIDLVTSNSNGVNHIPDINTGEAVAMETNDAVAMETSQERPPSSPESDEIPLAARTRTRPSRSTRSKKSFVEVNEYEDEEVFETKPPKGINLYEDSTPALVGTQSIFSSDIQKERRANLTKGAKKKKKKEPEFCRFCFTNELSLTKVRSAKLPPSSSHPNTKLTTLVPAVSEIDLCLSEKWTNPSFQLVCNECVLVFSQFYEFRQAVQTNDTLLRRLYCSSKAKSKKPPVTPAASSAVPTPKGRGRPPKHRDPSSGEDSDAKSTVSTKSIKKKARGKRKGVTDDEDTDGYLSSVSKASRKSTTSRKGAGKKKRVGVTSDEETDGYMSSVSRKSTNTGSATKSKKKRRYNSDSDNEDVKSDVSDGMDYAPTAYDDSEPIYVKVELLSSGDEQPPAEAIGNTGSEHERHIHQMICKEMMSSSEKEQLNSLEDEEETVTRRKPRKQQINCKDMSFFIEKEEEQLNSIEDEEETVTRRKTRKQQINCKDMSFFIEKEEELFVYNCIPKTTYELTCKHVWNPSGTKMTRVSEKKNFMRGSAKQIGDDEHINSYKLKTRAEVEWYLNDEIEQTEHIPLSKAGVDDDVASIENRCDLVWNNSQSRLVKLKQRKTSTKGDTGTSEQHCTVEYNTSEESSTDSNHTEEKDEEWKPLKPFVAPPKEPEEFKCRLCDLILSSYHKLGTHLKKIHNEKIAKGILCFICAKTFSSNKGLSHHIKHVHGGGQSSNFERPKELCYICSEEVHHLRQHMVKHVEPSLPCQICDKQFRRKTDLTYHIMSVHTREERFKCEVCGKGFALKAYMKRHMRQHTQDRGYKCVCGEGFNFNVSLKAHKAKCTEFLNSTTVEK